MWRRTVWLEPAVKPPIVYENVPVRAVWYTATGAGFVTPDTWIVLAGLMVVPPVKNASATYGADAGPPELMRTAPVEPPLPVVPAAPVVPPLPAAPDEPPLPAAPVLPPPVP